MFNADLHELMISDHCMILHSADPPFYMYRGNFDSYIMYSGDIFYMYSGYLPPEEVERLTMAYTTVYNLGLDKGEIMAAMNYARTTDIRSLIS
jgi:hypothetical protein